MSDARRLNWPYQRYGHTVIALGDCIYLFGGRNDETACNVLYEFNTTNYQWSKPRGKLELCVMSNVNIN